MLEVTPPQRNPSSAPGKADTRTLRVTFHVRDTSVRIYVENKLCATTSRPLLREWLKCKGVRANYHAEALRLRYSDVGIWFRVEHHTAPTILAKPAVNHLIRLLAS